MIRVLLYQLPQYRDVLSFFLEEKNNFYIVNSQWSKTELEKQIHQEQPHVVLLDISVDNGFDVLSRIKKYSPLVKVIILSNESDFSIVMQCLRNGADGYLLIKKTGLPKLPDYIVDTMEGGIPISPALVSGVMKELSTINQIASDAEKLTKREAQLLKLLVDGMSYKEISFCLNIALDTVRSHIKSIYSKLKVNSKSEAVVKALKRNIVIV